MTPRVAERCLCGAGGGTDLVRFGIDVRACDECGIFRQPLDCDEDALARWYAERYHDGIYHKSYAHDVGVAEKRLAAYGFDEGARILDVGAGNGAFVDVARQAGYDARGQEPGEQFEEHPYIYGAGSLADVGFPSDYFDVVTLNPPGTIRRNPAEPSPRGSPSPSPTGSTSAPGSRSSRPGRRDGS